MPNRLAGENSPYLLQHKDNPVNWYPWGEEALEKSKAEDKPIFLSIGYTACHWCHVMEHESFEDEETAKIMNEHFINVKVDREERPDIDRIYMTAVVAITGQGGWPMSVFLTPQGEPFFGGTYFPPVSRYGMPSFQDVLHSVANAWKDKREDVYQSGEQLKNHIQQSFSVAKKNLPLHHSVLDQASMTLAQSYDWEHGGWGKAPKFPQVMTIRFLLQRASTGDKMALDIAAHALEAMAKGGMYDVIGGGFARYSVDDFWLVPHFEKMLYDNALLAQVYLHAYMLTKNPFFREICEETLDFVIREMTDRQGGFYSSLDADTEGEEGKYYVWPYDEMASAIPDEQDLKIFSAAFGITEKGNFEGKNVLQRALDDEEVSKKLGIEREVVTATITRVKDILFKERRKRVYPIIDDKILVSWNAWMSIAFSEAARYLQREDYLKVAKSNMVFLLEYLQDESQEKLYRSWRHGKAQLNAYLEDYASLIIALLSLYQSDPNPSWYEHASHLTQVMLDKFSDPQGGFFDTPSDHEKLLARPKETQDNATPSGNSLASEALLKMSAFTGNGDWYDRANVGIKGVQGFLSKYPTGFGNWLCAMDFALGNVKEVAIIGNIQKKDMSSLVSVVWEELRPFTVLAVNAISEEVEGPPLLKDRNMIDGKATAYVCQKMVCKNPVSSPEELREQLAARPNQ